MKLMTAGMLSAAVVWMFPLPIAAQECTNCWINPITGKLESLDPSGKSPMPSAPAVSPTSRSTATAQRNTQPVVLVYGRMACGLTTRMMKELDNHRIAYQFKNVDDREGNQEMWALLRNSGQMSDSVRLPVLSVKGKVLVNASLNDVKAALR